MQGAQRRLVFVGKFFVFLNFFFCFGVAIFDLVHDYETTLPMLNVDIIWETFLKYE